MALPALENWETTRDSLHQAALALSTIAKLGRERDPKFYHHLSLQVTPQGLTSGATTYGEFALDFDQASVIYVSPAGKQTQVPLAGLDQVRLVDAILLATADAGFKPEPDRSDLTNQTPFVVEQAADYAEVLYAVHRAISAARATLPDDKTNLVVFPHHFDLSFLWFNGTAMNEHQPHINFGFSPGDSTISRPYFYSYAWDGEQYADLSVSAPLQHHPDFTTGVMMSYDDTLRDATDLNAVIAGAVVDIQRAAAGIW